MQSCGPGTGRCLACERAGKRQRNLAIANAAARYDRRRHLRTLLTVTQEELADHSIAGQRRLVARLLRTARHVASAGRSGHWSYDPNRHVEVLGALQVEQAALLAARMGGDGTEPYPPACARARISK